MMGGGRRIACTARRRAGAPCSTSGRPGPRCVRRVAPAHVGERGPGARGMRLRGGWRARATVRRDVVVRRSAATAGQARRHENMMTVASEPSSFSTRSRRPADAAAAELARLAARRAPHRAPAAPCPSPARDAGVQPHLRPVRPFPPSSRFPPGSTSRRLVRTARSRGARRPSLVHPCQRDDAFERARAAARVPRPIALIVATFGAFFARR